MNWNKVGIGSVAQGKQGQYVITPVSHTEMLVKQTGRTTRKARVPRDISAAKALAEAWDKEK